MADDRDDMRDDEATAGIGDEDLVGRAENEDEEFDSADDLDEGDEEDDAEEMNEE